MIDILTLTIPFFLIILSGSYARHKNWFDDASGRILAKFAFFVALPPFLFLSIISAPVSSVFDIRFVILYEAGTVIMFLFALIISRKIFMLKIGEGAIFSLNATYPNYGYIGVPLVLLAFGEKAAIPVALILVFDSIVLLCLTSFFSSQNNESSIAKGVSLAILSMFSNPLLPTVLLGLGCLIGGVKLPELPQFVLGILAGAAAPTALFALGITLVGQPIHYSAIKELSFLVCAKLIFHPMVLIILFLFWSSSNNHTIDPMWIKVAVIFSSLPIAANVFALSEFYSSYRGKTASAIVLSTVLSGLTIPCVLFFVSIAFL